MERQLPPLPLQGTIRNTLHPQAIQSPVRCAILMLLMARMWTAMLRGSLIHQAQESAPELRTKDQLPVLRVLWQVRRQGTGHAQQFTVIARGRA